MDNKDQKTILREAFGESSSESEEENDHILTPQHQSPSTPHPSPAWQPIKEVKGLWLCKPFLSPPTQSSLLSAILNEGWFKESNNNQAMRFGDLPSWAIQLSSDIRQAVLIGDSEDFGSDNDLLAPSILWREPLFDQLIVNVYQPGEGICAHVDLMRFEDGIAIVSLESSCVMHFTRVREGLDGMEAQIDPSKTTIPVYLTPGSLILMSGEARYQWTHEINRRPGFQVCEGQELNQKKRTSITLRKLCSVE